MSAALSWRRWSDLLVDFGTQLYLPWRISEGKVLYRDMAYVAGGPLSQYFNALLFKIFGVSFRTLIFANLALMAGMLTLLYRRFLAVADQLTATMVCLAIVLVFGFSHSLMVGNYNYVTPYCHEIFHGLLLSVLAVMWLADWISTRQIRFARASGLVWGLVFLTKPDVFLALSVCVAAAWVIAGYAGAALGWLAKSLGAFALAAWLPPLFFFMLFLGADNWRGSVGAVVSAWTPLSHLAVIRDPFYQWCLGLDLPFQHLEHMVVQFLVVVVITVIYTVMYRYGMDSRFKWARAFPVIWMLLLLPLLYRAITWSWFDCGESLPFLALSIGGLLWFIDRRNAAGPASRFPLLWVVFSLALLAKLGLNPRIWHYGFALAMPAFVAVVYGLVWLLPFWLASRHGIRTDWLRAGVCLVLLIGFVRLFLGSEWHYLRKQTAVGSGGDRIMAYGPEVDPFHNRVEQALSWIGTNIPPTATLAVLPEGAMINYLSRRVNPTPFPVWLPPEMETFGQTNMTAIFERNNPDYVLVIARSGSEFGVGFFGYDSHYGAELEQWLDEHYDQVYPAPDPARVSPAGSRSFQPVQFFKRRATGLSTGNN
ncbi:MAG TPA: hypothetical protein VMB80_04455 [Candidatus Acidoferrum sp.]|nr:hypothetical protein [Candidatus Acidoferrum sp.]